MAIKGKIYHELKNHLFVSINNSSIKYQKDLDIINIDYSGLLICRAYFLKFFKQIIEKSSKENEKMKKSAKDVFL